MTLVGAPAARRRRAGGRRPGRARQPAHRDRGRPGLAGAADDGYDMLYVKDCARAIASLQVAETLNHRTDNVGSGRVTTNREVLAALPGGGVALPGGDDGNVCLDITRLREDTGFRPAYDIGRAVEDYLAWIRTTPGPARSGRG